MFFDDFRPGMRFEAGSKTVSEEEILDFARRYDWQYFHTDPEKAKESPYGGLIASGFHTLLIAFGLDLGSDTWREASMGSPGMEHIRWIRPVRPGDTLSLTYEVAAVRPSHSKPDRGTVTFDHTLTNQHGEVVMTYRAHVILARRPVAREGAGDA